MRVPSEPWSIGRGRQMKAEGDLVESTPHLVVWSAKQEGCCPASNQWPLHWGCWSKWTGNLALGCHGVVTLWGPLWGDWYHSAFMCPSGTGSGILQTAVIWTQSGLPRLLYLPCIWGGLKSGWGFVCSVCHHVCVRVCVCACRSWTGTLGSLLGIPSKCMSMSMPHSACTGLMGWCSNWILWKQCGRSKQFSTQFGDLRQNWVVAGGTEAEQMAQCCLDVLSGRKAAKSLT